MHKRNKASRLYTAACMRSGAAGINGLPGDPGIRFQMSRFFASEDEYLSSEDDFYESYEDGLFQDDFSSVSSSSATHPGSDDESVGAVHEQPVTAATGKKSGFFDVSESESEGESVERAIVSYSDKHASECEELIVQIISLLESASWNGAFSGILGASFSRV